MPLNQALDSNNAEMTKRLKYTKDILTHMLNNNQQTAPGGGSSRGGANEPQALNSNSSRRAMQGLPGSSSNVGGGQQVPMNGFGLSAPNSVVSAGGSQGALSMGQNSKRKISIGSRGNLPGQQQ